MSDAPLRILFVDDSALVRDLVGTALRALGHEVIARGPEPSAQLRGLVVQHDCHAVVLDLLMPAPSGDELASELRASGPLDLTILLCSSLDPTQLAQRAKAVGAHGYVWKDGDFRQVARQIVSAIRAAR